MKILEKKFTTKEIFFDKVLILFVSSYEMILINEKILNFYMLKDLVISKKFFL